MGIVIEFEIDESVLADVDEVADRIGINREIYITAAIKHTLRHHRPKEMSAEDEANTFLMWLADDDDGPDGISPPDWPPDDGRLN